MKFWSIMVMITALLGCSSRMKNTIDSRKLSCGQTPVSQGDALLSLQADENSLWQAHKFQVFDAEGQAFQDFSVTDKHCLVMPAETAEERFVVYADELAGTVPASIPAFSTLALQSCGKDCVVFPLCGFFKADEPKDAGPWIYGKPAKVGAGLTINAWLETESGPQLVPISERGCFKLKPSQAGLLKLGDASGNFLEKNVQDLLAESEITAGVLSFSLRPPYSSAEIQCRKNSAQFKMVGDRCLPRDIRDYCEDFLSEIGRPTLKNVLGTDQCERIWQGFSQATALDLKGRLMPLLDLTYAKYFSGLAQLRILNIAQNSRVKTLRDVIGSEAIEELAIEGTAIPLGDLAAFPQLSRLSLGRIQPGWETLAPLPRIKQLKLTDETDLRILVALFPEVEHIKIVWSSHGKIDVSPIRDLHQLKTLEIFSANIGGRIAHLPALQSLKIHSLDALEGTFPALESLSTHDLARLDVLSGSPRLSSIDLVDYDGVDFVPKFESGTWPLASVKNARFHNVRNLAFLKNFPAIEKLELYYGSGTATFDLDIIRSLRSLQELTVEAPSARFQFADMELPELRRLSLRSRDRAAMQGFVLPKLEELDTDSSLDLASSTLPALRILKASNTIISLPLLPVLQELEFYTKIQDAKQLPKFADFMPALRRLTTNLETRELLALFPRTLTHASFKYISGPSADFLADLPNLQDVTIATSTLKSKGLDPLPVIPVRNLHLDLTEPGQLPVIFRVLNRLTTNQFNSQMLARLDLSACLEFEFIDRAEHAELLEMSDRSPIPAPTPGIMGHAENLRRIIIETNRDLVAWQAYFPALPSVVDVRLGKLHRRTGGFNPLQIFPKLEQLTIDRMAELLPADDDYAYDVNLLSQPAFNLRINGSTTVSDADWQRYQCFSTQPAPLQRSICEPFRPALSEIEYVF